MSPVSVLASVVITEVMCNPIGSDADGEWVKIQNIGTDQVDLTGWKFNDGNEERELLDVSENGGTGDMLLDVGEYALLARNAEQVTSSDNFPTGYTGTIIDTTMLLNNDGDTLTLIDSEGSEVDTITYIEDDVAVGESCFSYYTDTADQTGDDSGQDQPTTQTNIITKEITKYNTVTIEPPQDIYLRLTIPEITNTGTNARFFAEVYDAIGKSKNTPVDWSFGDGAVARGNEVKHRYSYAGEYTVSAYTKDGTLIDEAVKQIKVVDTDVMLHLDSEYDFVEIINNSEFNLDLSLWTLRSGYKYFHIPERTIMLPKSPLRLSTSITKLSTLKMEKSVLLLDSARNIVANSKDYIEVLGVGSTEQASTTGVLKESVEPASSVYTVPELSAQQDSSGTWYVASMGGASNVETNITTTLHHNGASLHEDYKEAEEISLIPEVESISQPAVALVSDTKNFSMFNIGIKWLLGLLFVISFGILTLRGFSGNGSKPPTDDFEITEIK